MDLVIQWLLFILGEDGPIIGGGTTADSSNGPSPDVWVPDSRAGD
jgi:hypothetical protein